MIEMFFIETIHQEKNNIVDVTTTISKYGKHFFRMKQLVFSATQHFDIYHQLTKIVFLKVDKNDTFCDNNCI